MTPTLYLSRTGMLEPLGQSQVLSYLKGLSQDHAITLISVERAADLADGEQLARMQAVCDAHGIRWVRLRYRQRPRVAASALNLTALVYHSWREARRSRARLIHARSYIPAAAAWAISRISGIPYIFDMRSLWPEELITSGRLRRGSRLHRLIFRAEGRLLSDAATVVSLTRAGARYLDTAHPGRLPAERVRVIPTCTDLDRFRPAKQTARDAAGAGPVIGCHGSLASGWFRTDLLAAMFDRLADRLPEARFEIITRDDPAWVRAALGEGAGWRDRLSISSAKASEIHGRLQQQDLSLFFYAAGAASELGRSPTRMGEALGCGVPVLSNAGIGDVAEILRDGNVGVVLDAEDAAALDRAADRAVAMMRDPDIPARCRAVAERVYSLDAGTRRYREIYRMLSGPGGQGPATDATDRPVAAETRKGDPSCQAY